MMKPKPVPREKIPWFPAIAAERCTSCGICSDFCPHNVYEKIAVPPGVVVKDPYACVVGCNNCESRCPEGAITFPDLEAITELIHKLRSEG
jgi:NAD-dependent dihydropyrimidine dehydrogenase PreA subunit